MDKQRHPCVAVGSFPRPWRKLKSQRWFPGRSQPNGSLRDLGKGGCSELFILSTDFFPVFLENVGLSVTFGHGLQLPPFLGNCGTQSLLRFALFI